MFPHARAETPQAGRHYVHDFIRCAWNPHLIKLNKLHVYSLFLDRHLGISKSSLLASSICLNSRFINYFFLRHRHLTICPKFRQWTPLQDWCFPTVYAYVLWYLSSSFVGLRLQMLALGLSDDVEGASSFSIHHSGHCRVWLPRCPSALHNVIWGS